MEMSSPAAVEALGALAQEHRLAAFRLLVQAGEQGVAAGVLAEKLDVPPSSMSFHLAQLANAGLVTQRRESRSIIYSADYAAMYGPTTGDRVRLADTDLIIEVERDLTAEAVGRAAGGNAPDVYLPDKTEQVLFCELTDGQRACYEQYLASPEVRAALDDATYSKLNSMIFFNTIDIVTHLQRDTAFLRRLFALLRSRGTPRIAGRLLRRAAPSAAVARPTTPHRK